MAMEGPDGEGEEKVPALNLSTLTKNVVDLFYWAGFVFFYFLAVSYAFLYLCCRVMCVKLHE